MEILNPARQFLHTLIAAMILATACAPASADDAVAEYRIKAAFLFKFGSYVDWPPEAFADADSPFVIGVIGAEQVAGDLAGIVEKRNIGGRRIEVRRLDANESLAGVHVLFVARAADRNLATVLDGVANQPTLVVTETDDTLAGGAINFVVVNNKVRFDVRLAQAGARNLKISARLLDVARRVIDGSS